MSRASLLVLLVTMLLAAACTATGATTTTLDKVALGDDLLEAVQEVKPNAEWGPMFLTAWLVACPLVGGTSPFNTNLDVRDLPIPDDLTSEEASALTSQEKGDRIDILIDAALPVSEGMTRLDMLLYLESILEVDQAGTAPLGFFCDNYFPFSEP